MTKTDSFRLKIEKVLVRKGVRSPLAREILLGQMQAAAFLSVAGLLLLFWTPWALFAAAGAAISTWHLWHIVRFAEGCTSKIFSVGLGLRLFTGFLLRLIVTGLVLFVLLIRLNAPPAALIVGLASTAAVLTVWGLMRFSRKPAKET